MKIQNRYIKMTMGLNQNTPGYIWRMEAGKHSLEITARKRPSKFLTNVLELGKERWTYICLRKELRGILNGNRLKWGEELEKAMNEVGDREIIS